MDDRPEFKKLQNFLEEDESEADKFVNEEELTIDTVEPVDSMKQFFAKVMDILNFFSRKNVEGRTKNIMGVIFGKLKSREATHRSKEGREEQLL